MFYSKAQALFELVSITEMSYPSRLNSALKHYCRVTELAIVKFGLLRLTEIVRLRANLFYQLIIAKFFGLILIHMLTSTSSRMSCEPHGYFRYYKIGFNSLDKIFRHHSLHTHQILICLLQHLF